MHESIPLQEEGLKLKLIVVILAITLVLSMSLITWLSSFVVAILIPCSFLLQPLDVILAQDHNQIVALLEYVRYDFQLQIQQSSIKIMSILRHSSSPFFTFILSLVQLSAYCLKYFVAMPCV